MIYFSRGYDQMQRLLRMPGELGLLILVTYWVIRFSNFWLIACF